MTHSDARHADRPSPPSGGGQRVRPTRRNRWIVWSLLALLLVALALPVFALTTEPGQRVTANLIEEPLLARIKAAIPEPYELNVDGLTTNIGPSAFDVRLSGLTVSGPGILVSARDTHVKVLFRDVLRRALVPKAVTIGSMDVDLDPQALEFAFTGVQEADHISTSARLERLLAGLGDVDAALAHVTTHPSWASLEQMQIARISVMDRAQSTLPIARDPPDLELSIERHSADEVRLTASTLDRAVPTQVLLRHAHSDPPQGPVALADIKRSRGFDETAFTHAIVLDVPLSDLTTALSGAGPVTVDGRIGAEMVVTRDPADGRVDQLSLTLESEGATLTASDGQSTRFELVSLPMLYSRAEAQDTSVQSADAPTDDFAGGFRILGAQLRFPQTGGAFQGAIVPAEQDGVSGLDIMLASPDYQLVVPASEVLQRDARPLDATVWLSAFLPDDADDLHVRLFELQQESASVVLSGFLENMAERPVVSLAGQSSPMSAEQLAAVWPLPLAPGARNWFGNTISEGSIAAGRFTFAAALEDIEIRDGRSFMRDDMMRFALPYANLVMRTVGDLPPIFGLDGDLLVTGRTLTLTGENGAGRMTGGETMSVDSLNFHIPDHALRNPDASLQLDLEGPVSGFLQMASLDPISLDPRTLPLDADSVSGRMQMTTELQARLADTLDREAVQTSFEATVSDLASSQPIDGRQLSGGDFRLTGDRQGVSIEGRALIDGVPTDLSFSTAQGDDLQLSMRLDAQARERIGLDFGSYLNGTIEVRLGSEAPGGSRPVDVDLTDAGLTIAELGWSKPAGTPAQAQFDMVEDGSTIRVTNLVVAATGLVLRGSLDLSNGQLRNAQFDSIALEGVGSFALALTRNDNQTAARITGDRFTLLPDVLRGNPEAAGDLSVEIDLQEVRTKQGETLSGVRMRYVQNADRIMAFDLRASHSDGSELVGTLAQQDGGRGLVISSGNAGTFLRFLGLYEKAFGGRATLVLDPESVGGRIAGQLLLNDYVIADEPAMARIFNDARSQGSSSEIVLPGAVETSDRVQIDVTNVSFDRTPERLVIREAEGWGPSLGGNLRGVIDYAGNEVNLAGTYVPFFSINNFFSRIPILGTALGNRQSEGLLGITFELVGSVDQPELRVNPISLLAPGVFRNIFQSEQGG
ncbi:MAG: DUF3971 domain-containing protein [Pseudomonadota bacterium]